MLLNVSAAVTTKLSFNILCIKDILYITTIFIGIIAPGSMHVTYYNMTSSISGGTSPSRWSLARFLAVYASLTNTGSKGKLVGNGVVGSKMIFSSAIVFSKKNLTSST